MLCARQFAQYRTEMPVVSIRMRLNEKAKPVLGEFGLHCERLKIQMEPPGLCHDLKQVRLDLIAETTACI